MHALSQSALTHDCVLLSFVPAFLWGWCALFFSVVAPAFRPLVDRCIECMRVCVWRRSAKGPMAKITRLHACVAATTSSPSMAPECHVCMYAMYVCHVCMPCMYAMYVCVPSLYGSRVPCCMCVSMPCMPSLYYPLWLPSAMYACVYAMYALPRWLPSATACK